jgi:hypothetical protein
VNRQNPGLVAGQQVIDKVANNRVGFVSKLRDNAADQRGTARVPFQIDCTVKVSCAVDLCPAMWPARLFRPDFDEAEFSFQLRVTHDFIAQRSAPGRDDLNYRLHSLVRFDGCRVFAMLV